jgi:hypothetical protein
MKIHVSASTGTTSNLAVNVATSTAVKTGAAALLASHSRSSETASFALFAQSAVTASYVGAGGIIESSSYSLFAVNATNAVSASHANVAQWQLLQGLPVGLVSSSAQLDLGTTDSASYAAFAVTAHQADSASMVTFANVTAKPSLLSSSLQINTGSFSGSFKGDGSAVLGVVSASFAATTILPTTIPTASFVDYTGVGNKPVGLVSSSIQINSGSFTGSFRGDGSGLAGTVSASFAVTASYASNVSQADFNTLLNKPSLLSSSLQINTGSFSGSFKGDGSALLGVVSASYAANVSAADFNTLLNKPTLVSSSLQINTGSFKGDGSGLTGIVSASYSLSASYAPTSGPADFNTILNKPVGLVSSSLQINTGSFSGSFKGDGSALLGVVSSSYALSASYAPTSGPADFTTLLNKPVGLVSSSLQINTGSFSGSFKGDGSAVLGVISSSYAVTASYATVAQTLLGSVTSATSASYATTASFAQTVNPSYQPLTASYALSAGATGGGLVGTGTTGRISKFTNSSAIGDSIISEIGALIRVGGGVEITGSMLVTTDVTASAFKGVGTAITGVVSASYAVTASYASNVSAADFTTLLNKPVGLVSSSLQINTGSFSGSFKGDGSAVLGVVSASYAANVIVPDFTTLLNKPTGLVSSSLQINTGSFSGSFKGDGSALLGVVSSSYAVTASYAANVTPADFNTILNKPVGLSARDFIATGGSFKGDGSAVLGVVSASYAANVVPADFTTLLNKPVGLVSSSLQINTGSFSGSARCWGLSLARMQSQLHSQAMWFLRTSIPS